MEKIGPITPEPPQGAAEEFDDDDDDEDEDETRMNYGSPSTDD